MLLASGVFSAHSSSREDFEREVAAADALDSVDLFAASGADQPEPGASGWQTAGLGTQCTCGGMCLCFLTRAEAGACCRCAGGGPICCHCCRACTTTAGRQCTVRSRGSASGWQLLPCCPGPAKLCCALSTAGRCSRRGRGAPPAARRGARAAQRTVWAAAGRGQHGGGRVRRIHGADLLQPGGLLLGWAEPVQGRLHGRVVQAAERRAVRAGHLRPPAPAAVACTCAACWLGWDPCQLSLQKPCGLGWGEIAQLSDLRHRRLAHCPPGCGPGPQSSQQTAEHRILLLSSRKLRPLI